MCTYMGIRVSMNVCAYIHVCLCRRICTYVRLFALISIYIYIYMGIYMDICRHICLPLFARRGCLYTLTLNVCATCPAKGDLACAVGGSGVGSVVLGRRVVVCGDVRYQFPARPRALSGTCVSRAVMARLVCARACVRVCVFSCQNIIINIEVA